MQAERIPARRSPEGGYIVQVDDLQVGDRMGFAGAGRTLWVPIIDIAEKPKTRVFTLQMGQFTGTAEQRMRRDTLIERAPRVVRVTHDMPGDVVAYGADLYFDDGAYPNAEVEHIGYFAIESEAWDAVRDALAKKPSAQPSTVEPGNTASWCGIVERGTFVYPPDAEWFAEPDFERDEDYNPDAIWPEDLA
jgi:hypothetical protein